MPRANPVDRLPPFDEAAEAGALGCILCAANGDAAGMLDALTVDDFYDVRHREIYTALRRLRLDLDPLDSVALLQWLKDNGKIEAAGGMDYLTALPDKTPSPANWPTYRETLCDRATRRAVLRDAADLAEAASNIAIPRATLWTAARRMATAYAEAPEGDPWLGLIEDAAVTVTKTLPPTVEIVEGIVAEYSKLGIGSGSKSNKTWLAMDLGLSISHGVEFLGRRTARRRVLYVNLELKAQTFERRIQAIAAAKHIAVEPAWFHHLALRGKLAGASLDRIVDRLITLAKRLQLSVVILDPTYKLNTAGLENDSRDQTLFYNEIDRLTTDAGCTVILIDHAGKGNQSEKDPLDVFRGSSVKGGDFDAAMVLRKHEIEDCFRVDLIHRELAPVPAFTIGWEYPLMHLRPDLDPDAMKKAKGGRKRTHEFQDLLAAIADTSAENPVTITAWATAAAVKRPTLVGYLSEMRSKGWIATTGEGSSARQYLTAKGRQYLREAACQN
jgi:predicted transcriptional regulator